MKNGYMDFRTQVIIRFSPKCGYNLFRNNVHVNDSVAMRNGNKIKGKCIPNIPLTILKPLV